MTRVSALVLAALLLGSCKQAPERKAAMSYSEIQKVQATFPGMTRACVEQIRAGGTEAMPKKTQDCFEMGPSQRWTGLWRNQIEGSQFCPDEPGEPATKCPVAGPEIWFDPEGYSPDGGLYRVEFVGRRTAKPGHFGAYGFFSFEVVLDRMISIRALPPPTREQGKKAWKQCVAAGKCHPPPELRGYPKE